MHKEPAEGATALSVVVISVHWWERNCARQQSRDGTFWVMMCTSASWPALNAELLLIKKLPKAQLKQAGNLLSGQSCALNKNLCNISKTTRKSGLHLSCTSKAELATKLGGIQFLCSNCSDRHWECKAELLQSPGARGEQQSGHTNKHSNFTAN